MYILPEVLNLEISRCIIFTKIDKQIQLKKKKTIISFSRFYHVNKQLYI